MTINIYKEILKELKNIITGTEWENHIFSVGGCNRDYIMGNEIKDIDFVCDLPNGGINFAKWLKENEYVNNSIVVYENFGTAMFHLNKFPDIELEVVHTRKECYHDAKTRNPETSFGTLLEDWERRDFTINAIYYNISKGQFLDFKDRGKTDIEKKIIRTCSLNPDIVFTEDPLRILRMVRFATKLGFEIDNNTFSSAKKNTNRLSIISKERIQDELNKMLTSGNADYAMKLIYDLGADEYIFNSKINCPEQIIKSLKKYKLLPNCDVKNLEANLTIIYSFYPDVEDKMKYLKYSNEIISLVMFYFDLFDDINLSTMTPSGIRRIQYNSKTFNNLINACNIVTAVLNTPNVNKILESTNKMVKAGIAMFDYKLPVDGNDVMRVLHIKPSPVVKTKLDFLLNQAFINPFLSKFDCELLLELN